MSNVVPQGAQAPRQTTALAIVKGLINMEETKKRFSDVLGNKAPQFLGSIISLVSSRTDFSDCDPSTIMGSAMMAATMDLPINQNLGYAYIIPYKDGGVKKAQFQMGYKGYIQLALRTGQYKTINATEVYEGELLENNRLTGIIEIDPSKRLSEKVVGYAAYFRLLNGFEKTWYMSMEEMEAHAKKYSKSYGYNSSPWKSNFDDMALKTVIKLVLSKFGILSVQMQAAVEYDQAVAEDKKDSLEIQYTDSTTPRTERADEAAAPQMPVAESAVEVKPEAKPEAKKAASPAEVPAVESQPEQSEVAVVVEPKPVQRTEKVIFTEVMAELENLKTMEELSGWKSLVSHDLSKLSPLKYDVVVNAISEKEQSLSAPQNVIKPAVAEWLKKIEEARMVTTVQGFTAKIVADLKAGKLDLDDRNLLIQACDDRATAITEAKKK
jgi:recombination protein RecT